MDIDEKKIFSIVFEEDEANNEENNSEVNNTFFTSELLKSIGNTEEFTGKLDKFLTYIGRNIYKKLQNKYKVSDYITPISYIIPKTKPVDTATSLIDSVMSESIRQYVPILKRQNVNIQKQEVKPKQEMKQPQQEIEDKVPKVGISSSQEKDLFNSFNNYTLLQSEGARISNVTNFLGLGVLSKQLNNYTPVDLSDIEKLPSLDRFSTNLSVNTSKLQLDITKEQPLQTSNINTYVPREVDKESKDVSIVDVLEGGINALGFIGSLLGFGGSVVTRSIGSLIVNLSTKSAEELSKTYFRFANEYGNDFDGADVQKQKDLIKRFLEKDLIENKEQWNKSLVTIVEMYYPGEKDLIYNRIFGRLKTEPLLSGKVSEIVLENKKALDILTDAFYNAVSKFREYEKKGNLNKLPVFNTDKFKEIYDKVGVFGYSAVDLFLINRKLFHGTIDEKEDDVVIDKDRGLNVGEIVSGLFIDVFTDPLTYIVPVRFLKTVATSVRLGKYHLGSNFTSSILDNLKQVIDDIKISHGNYNVYKTYVKFGDKIKDLGVIGSFNDLSNKLIFLLKDIPDDKKSAILSDISDLKNIIRDNYKHIEYPFESEIENTLAMVDELVVKENVEPSDVISVATVVNSLTKKVSEYVYNRKFKNFKQKDIRLLQEYFDDVSQLNDFTRVAILKDYAGVYGIEDALKILDKVRVSKKYSLRRALLDINRMLTFSNELELLKTSEYYKNVEDYLVYLRGLITENNKMEDNVKTLILRQVKVLRHFFYRLSRMQGKSDILDVEKISSKPDLSYLFFYTIPIIIFSQKVKIPDERFLLDIAINSEVSKEDLLENLLKSSGINFDKEDIKTLNDVFSKVDGDVVISRGVVNQSSYVDEISQSRNVDNVFQEEDINLDEILEGGGDSSSVYTFKLPGTSLNYFRMYNLVKKYGNDIDKLPDTNIIKKLFNVYRNAFSEVEGSVNSNVLYFLNEVLTNKIISSTIENVDILKNKDVIKDILDSASKIVGKIQIDGSSLKNIINSIKQIDIENLVDAINHNISEITTKHRISLTSDVNKIKDEISDTINRIVDFVSYLDEINIVPLVLANSKDLNKNVTRDLFIRVSSDVIRSDVSGIMYSMNLLKKSEEILSKYDKKIKDEVEKNLFWIPTYLMMLETKEIDPDIFISSLKSIKEKIKEEDFDKIKKILGIEEYKDEVTEGISKQSDEYSEKIDRDIEEIFKDYENYEKEQLLEEGFSIVGEGVDDVIDEVVEGVNAKFDFKKLVKNIEKVKKQIIKEKVNFITPIGLNVELRKLKDIEKIKRDVTNSLNSLSKLLTEHILNETVSPIINSFLIRPHSVTQIYPKGLYKPILITDEELEIVKKERGVETKLDVLSQKIKTLISNNNLYKTISKKVEELGINLDKKDVNNAYYIWRGLLTLEELKTTDIISSTWKEAIATNVVTTALRTIKYWLKQAFSAYNNITPISEKLIEEASRKIQKDLVNIENYINYLVAEVEMFKKNFGNIIGMSLDSDDIRHFISFTINNRWNDLVFTSNHWYAPILDEIQNYNDLVKKFIEIIEPEPELLLKIPQDPNKKLIVDLFSYLSTTNDINRDKFIKIIKQVGGIEKENNLLYEQLLRHVVNTLSIYDTLYSDVVGFGMFYYPIKKIIDKIKEIGVVLKQKEGVNKYEYELLSRNIKEVADMTPEDFFSRLTEKINDVFSEIINESYEPIIKEGIPLLKVSDNYDVVEDYFLLLNPTLTRKLFLYLLLDSKEGDVVSKVMMRLINLSESLPVPRLENIDAKLWITRVAKYTKVGKVTSDAVSLEELLRREVMPDYYQYFMKHLPANTANILLTSFAKSRNVIKDYSGLLKNIPSDRRGEVEKVLEKVEKVLNTDNEGKETVSIFKELLNNISSIVGKKTTLIPEGIKSTLKSKVGVEYPLPYLNDITQTLVVKLVEKQAKMRTTETLRTIVLHSTPHPILGTVVLGKEKAEISVWKMDDLKSRISVPSYSDMFIKTTPFIDELYKGVASTKLVNVNIPENQKFLDVLKVLGIPLAQSTPVAGRLYALFLDFFKGLYKSLGGNAIENESEVFKYIYMQMITRSEKTQLVDDIILKKVWSYDIFRSFYDYVKRVIQVVTDKANKEINVQEEFKSIFMFINKFYEITSAIKDKSVRNKVEEISKDLLLKLFSKPSVKDITDDDIKGIVDVIENKRIVKNVVEAIKHIIEQLEDVDVSIIDKYNDVIAKMIDEVLEDTKIIVSGEKGTIVLENDIDNIILRVMKKNLSDLRNSILETLIKNRGNVDIDFSSGIAKVLFNDNTLKSRLRGNTYSRMLDDDLLDKLFEKIKKGEENELGFVLSNELSKLPIRDDISRIINSTQLKNFVIERIIDYDRFSNIYFTVADIGGDIKVKHKKLIPTTTSGEEMEKFINEIKDIDKSKDVKEILIKLNNSSIVDKFFVSNPLKDAGFFIYKRLYDDMVNFVLSALDTSKYNKLFEFFNKFSGMIRRNFLAWYPSFYIQNLIDATFRNIIENVDVGTMTISTAFVLKKILKMTTNDDILNAILLFKDKIHLPTRDFIEEVKKEFGENIRIIDTQLPEDMEKLIIKFSGVRSDIEVKVSDLRNALERENIDIYNYIGNIVKGIGNIKKILIGVNTERGFMSAIEIGDTIKVKDKDGFEIDLDDLWNEAVENKIFTIGMTELLVAKNTLYRETTKMLETSFNNILRNVSTEQRIKSIEKFIQENIKRIPSVLLENFNSGIIETISRFSLYVDRRLKGFSPFYAKNEVDRIQFDYSRLSGFERNVMNNMFFFYTFWKRNMQYAINLAFRKISLIVEPIKTYYALGGDSMPGVEYTIALPVVMKNENTMSYFDLTKVFSPMMYFKMLQESVDGYLNDVYWNLRIYDIVSKQTGVKHNLLPTVISELPELVSPFVNDVIRMTNPIFKIAVIFSGVYIDNLGRIRELRDNDMYVINVLGNHFIIPKNLMQFRAFFRRLPSTEQEFQKFLNPLTLVDVNLDSFMLNEVRNLEKQLPMSVLYLASQISKYKSQGKDTKILVDLYVANATKAILEKVRNINKLKQKTDTIDYLKRIISVQKKINIDDERRTR